MSLLSSTCRNFICRCWIKVFLVDAIDETQTGTGFALTSDKTHKGQRESIIAFYFPSFFLWTWVALTRLSKFSARQSQLCSGFKDTSVIRALHYSVQYSSLLSTHRAIWSNLLMIYKHIIWPKVCGHTIVCKFPFSFVNVKMHILRQQLDKEFQWDVEEPDLLLYWAISISDLCLYQMFACMTYSMFTFVLHVSHSYHDKSV